MQRKIKLPVAVGDTLTLFTKNGSLPSHIRLVAFCVDNNRVSWEFRSHQRHSITGMNVRERARLPFFEEDSWICLSIPLTAHIGIDTLKPEFILSVPSSVVVQRNDPSAAKAFPK